MRKLIPFILCVSVGAAACGDDDGSTSSDAGTGSAPSTTDTSDASSALSPTAEAQLMDVEGTPSATGLVQIGTNAAGETVVELGSDFMQATGPGDTELRLAQTDENVQEQLDADPMSVSPALGIIPNGGSGSFSFTVPSSIDVNDFDNVIIWCPTAGVNFGVGTLADL